MEQLKKEFRKQEDHLEKIEKAFINYKKSPKERITPSYIESRLESLDTIWKEFNTVHTNIVERVSKEDKSKTEYFEADVYSEFEETYTEYKVKLKDDLAKLAISTTATSVKHIPSQAGCKVKLPQIQLPSFKGSYEEWQTFHDMFVSLIHTNLSLNPVQKLHYLKSCLSGEPERLLMNLATTQNNYEEAWKQMTKRYNNKRYNVSEVMKRLFAQKPIITESSTQIKHLLDNTAACLKALNNLGTDTKSWDTIVNYLVLTKLDPESRKAWELDVNKKDADSLPTWDDLVSFLETRFRTLEMLEECKPTSNKQVPKRNTFHCKVEEKKEEEKENNYYKVACVMCTNEQVKVKVKIHLFNKITGITLNRRFYLLPVLPRPSQERKARLKKKRTEEINKPNTVYLPHHAVVKQDRETTKVRVVYDASCKGTNNVSLNDTLLVGPKIQDDLRHILMRWRYHPYCIVADVTQMYRQILVHENDTDYQRIMWRAEANQPIQHFRLLRLTFGTACAPYLAVKSLQQVAKDEKCKYPIAAEITLRDFYMDDLLTGCETESETIEIFDQMNELMNAGGFTLQKWCTNSELLSNYIKQESQNVYQKLVFKSDNIMKVLGICWNKTTDQFEYSYKITETNEPITKRKVLSDIARLYDPMGWIAPVIIVAKIFMQKLWKSNLTWDENLSPDLLKEWLNFKESLRNVQSILIPRWLNTKKKNTCELHGFADASSAAYAATVFIKVQDELQNTNVHLISAKTKVAPIDKEISIPRLELCAALLTAKLLYEVSQIMDIPKEKLFAWSDSTVVLAWIKGEPSRWTTFVSNRVSEILTMLDRDHWNHVSTHLNPADCASRGLLSKDLMKHELWWHGPKFLLDDQDYRTELTFTTTEEKKSIKTLTATVKPKEDFIWTKFSNLQKTLRIISYCRRFLRLKVSKEQRELKTKIVTKNEMEEASEICIKEIQKLYFDEEIKVLKTNGNISKRSLLESLNPFLDKREILRVGGRINQSEEDFDKKHPIIMPNESHFTRLIVLDVHLRTLHGGPQIMLNLLRSKYWIIRGREMVKKCYKQCITCIRYSKQKNNQLMGQLPKARITPTRPFKSAGVDFTGHINIRFSPGRGAKSYKGYICLFICMVTRAIHLEAVSDLTSKGFIAAFRRFVSRRGHCQDLYSDNGTNFIGADKELRQMFNRAVSQLPNEIDQLLANEGTKWHFIPPHAPNFGGLWEAGVRSTKSHLKTVIGDTTLTFEELTTVLTQIEACLNSRPISYLSDNPNDPLPLTPGHFLVGEPLIVIPDEDYSLDHSTGLTRWRLCQKMLDSFWKRWSKEYLVTLNNRYKWSVKKEEPNIDDVVIIREDNLPPAKWLLGKIVQKHPGKDNITRVVTLKTKSGLCKRPCNKLSFLLKGQKEIDNICES